MFDENQIVQVRWNNTNELWYRDRGYTFTGKNTLFGVKAKDLALHSTQKIKVVCDYCGREFETQYSIIANGHNVVQKDACSRCTGKKTSEVSWRRRAIKYFGKAEKVCNSEGYTMITKIDEYTDVKMPILFSCPKHGIQKMFLNNLIKGHRCRECGHDSISKKNKLDKNHIQSVINSKGVEWLNPDDYTICTDRNLKIRCSCGNVFTTSFVNLSRANVFRCSVCSQKESIGELKIREFLELHNIKYEQEKRFPDCRDKKPLPFDFYLPANNMCIEFDGAHHYQDVRNVLSLETTKHHDKIKNDYCKDAGIKLLRIPYWEGNKINDILSKEIII